MQKRTSNLTSADLTALWTLGLGAHQSWSERMSILATSYLASWKNQGLSQVQNRNEKRSLLTNDLIERRNIGPP